MCKLYKALVQTSKGKSCKTRALCNGQGMTFGGYSEGYEGAAGEFIGNQQPSSALTRLVAADCQSSSGLWTSDDKNESLNEPLL